MKNSTAMNQQNKGDSGRIPHTCTKEEICRTKVSFKNLKRGQQIVRQEDIYGKIYKRTSYIFPFHFGNSDINSTDLKIDLI